MNYQTARDEVAKLLQSNGKRQRFLGWVRAMLFLAMIGAIVLATGVTPEFWALFVVVLGVFLRVVVLHQRKRDNGVFLQYQLDILAFELQGGLHPFAKPAEANVQTSIAIDLDLFAPKGLFENFNRAVSPQGADFIAQQMQEPFSEVSTIEQQQEIIQEWRKHIPLIHELMAEGLAASKQYGQSPQLERSHFQKYAFLPWLLSVLGMGTLVGQFFGLSYIWLVIAFIGNIAVISVFKKETIAIGKQLAGQEEVFGAYAKIFRRLLSARVEHPQLLELHKMAEFASQGLHKLSKITNSFEQLFNLFVQAILNGLLGYELHVLLSYSKWEEKYASQLPHWIEKIQQLDYWNSLAIWAHNHPSFSVPEISSDYRGISAAALGHPLLKAEERVDNPADFSVDVNRVSLVTGSNMSGKSTYLRSIGINVLLARMGAVVCGNQVRLGPLRLLTFIRVSDSLSEGASYFYAELSRLKEIRTTLADQVPTVVLLDEILRGTNSEDKYLGSKRFAEALLKYPVIAIMATHDLKLSQLEEKHPKQVRNLAFESELTNDTLVFDYKLRYSVARNRNATYLMEKMGVID